jgi:hypothetical protein
MDANYLDHHGPLVTQRDMGLVLTTATNMENKNYLCQHDKNHSPEDRGRANSQNIKVH